jgi:hypothetical protein
LATTLLLLGLFLSFSLFYNNFVFLQNRHPSIRIHLVVENDFVDFLRVIVPLEKHRCLALFHHLFVAKFRPYLLDALNFGVYDFTLLLAIAVLEPITPLGQVELEVKWQQVIWGNEVDKGKANALTGADVQWQVEVVVRLREVLVNQAQNIALGKLDWDVFDHKCGLAQDFVIVFGEQEAVKINLLDQGALELLFLGVHHVEGLLLLDFLVLERGGGIALLERLIEQLKLVQLHHVVHIYLVDRLALLMAQ